MDWHRIWYISRRFDKHGYDSGLSCWTTEHCTGKKALSVFWLCNKLNNWDSASFSYISGTNYEICVDLPTLICNLLYSTPTGHYECNRMGFGLANAPSLFMRLMSQVMEGLVNQGCIVYLDILRYDRTSAEHLAGLRDFLTPTCSKPRTKAEKNANSFKNASAS